MRSRVDALIASINACTSSTRVASAFLLAKELVTKHAFEERHASLIKKVAIECFSDKKYRWTVKLLTHIPVKARDIAMFDMLQFSHYQLRSSVGAYNLLHQVKSAGVIPSLDMYKIAIHTACVANADPDRAIRIFRSMHRQTTPDVFIYTLLLGHYGVMHNQWDIVAELLDHRVRQNKTGGIDEELFTAAIDRCTDMKSLIGGRRIVQECIHRGGILSEDVIVSMLELCSECQDHTGFMNILNLNQPSAMSDTVVELYIKVLGRSGEVHNMLRCLEEIPAPTRLSYLNALTCATATSNDLVMSILEKLRYQFLGQSLQVYTELIGLLTSMPGGGLSNQAVDLYMEMRSFGLRPGPKVYMALLKVSTVDLDYSMALLTDAVNDWGLDHVHLFPALNTHIESCVSIAQCGNMGQALDYLAYLHFKLQISIPAHLFTKLILYSTSSQQLYNCIGLSEKCCGSELVYLLPISLAKGNAIADAVLSLKYMHDIMNYSLDYALFQSLLPYLTSNQTLELIEMALDVGIANRAERCKLLECAVSRLRDLKSPKSINKLLLLHNAGSSVDSVQLSCLEAFVHLVALDSVVNLVKVLRPKSKTCHKMLTSITKGIRSNHDNSHHLSLYTRLNDIGLSMDSYILVYLLKATTPGNYQSRILVNKIVERLPTFRKHRTRGVIMNEFIQYAQKSHDIELLQRLCIYPGNKSVIFDSLHLNEYLINVKSPDHACEFLHIISPGEAPLLFYSHWLSFLILNRRWDLIHDVIKKCIEDHEIFPKRCITELVELYIRTYMDNENEEVLNILGLLKPQHIEHRVISKILHKSKSKTRADHIRPILRGISPKVEE